TLVGFGVAVAQDAIASVWYYWGKEKWGNHAFRLVRLTIGVGIVIIGAMI
ncbi:hypothetical protein LCGC14_2322820, partial [marine sediment metagenome]